MKKLIWICAVFTCFNCDSGTGSNDDSDQTNTSALTVGDTFSGFEVLSVCANEDIEYNHDDASKVILLSLFASWCSTCQGHVSSLESLHQQYSDQGLLVISAGKDIGNPYTCESWVTEFGASYMIANDNSGEVEQQFSIDGQVPYHVLIDKSKTVRYSASGYDQSTLEALIQSTLAE